MNQELQEFENMRSHVSRNSMNIVSDHCNEFEQITFLVTQIFSVPYSFMSFVTGDTVFFKAQQGISIQQMSREISFCERTIQKNELNILEDIWTHSEYHDNPAVKDPPLFRFYVGAPIVTEDGFRIGALCVADTKAHTPNLEQIKSLQALANQTASLLELKKLKLDEKKKIDIISKAEKMSVLGEMAGGIAHEINNPLALINWKSMVLKKHIEDGSYNRDTLIKELLKIVSITERISKIVKGLRAFSRNTDLDPFEMIKAKSIIDDTLELCQARLAKENIEMKVHSIPDINVTCRSSQIIQIILNLISNSIDAIENLAEKWIDISVSIENNFVVFNVMDSGKGIPKEISLQMMQSFFTTKKKDKGTGLGLSISLTIAKSHNGDLFYDSSSVNTKFKLKIPLTQNN